MSKKKKIILLVAMVAVLAIAAYVNIWLINSNSGGQKAGTDDGNSVPTASFFSTYRTDRQTTRNYEIEMLDEIIATQGDEYATARANALEQKMRLVEVTETELLLETMLKAQGFEDAVVSIGTTSQNINVIVSADELTKEDTAKIYNIISSELKTSPDFIKILAI